MNTKFGSVFFLLLIGFVLQAQAQEDPVLQIKNNRLVSATNLYPDNLACSSKRLTGTVSKIENAGEWVELAVQTKTGRKKYVVAIFEPG